MQNSGWKLGCWLAIWFCSAGLEAADRPLQGADTHDNREEIVLIDFGTGWRYWDQEADPEAGWEQPDYADQQWPSGAGLLGYDTRQQDDRWPTPGLVTRLRPNQLTYLFRTDFDYQGPLNGVQLKIDHVIDDAAVIYLNGSEIARTGLLPAGKVPFGTPASGSIGTPGLVRDAWVISNPPLRSGKNVLAVSLHNQRRNSTDACLGLRLSVSGAPVPPLAMYLGWQQDPTTTMTVQWHAADGEQGAFLQYRLRGEAEARTAPAPATGQLAFSERTIYTVELTELKPDTEYEFRMVHPQERGSSQWYWFRTMPSDIKNPDRPLRLVFGGDLMHSRQWLAEANRQAARLNPDAIVWGGDLAYANGAQENLSRWEQFLETCLQTLVTAEGRIIPLIVGIGNHEVQGGFYWGNQRGKENYQDTADFRAAIAPYFYSLFAFPGQPGYGVLDFGDYLSILILDTDHANPIEGRQTQWLQQQLAQRQGVTHIFPVYHVPAFPSVRSYEGEVSQRVREWWVPLFENSQVRVCFEHHDHAYKRTIPIRELSPDPRGITYLGDGAWGVALREQHPLEKTWYLARAEQEHHVILATLLDQQLVIQVFASDGRLIDQWIPGAR
jgi:hypothetical protein